MGDISNLPPACHLGPLARGIHFALPLDYTDENDDPVPITSARFVVRKGKDGSAMIDVTEADVQVTLGAPGHVDIILSGTDTELLECGCWPYSVVVNGDDLILWGEITVAEDAVQ